MPSGNDAGASLVIVKFEWSVAVAETRVTLVP